VDRSNPDTMWSRWRLRCVSVEYRTVASSAQHARGERTDVGWLFRGGRKTSLGKLFFHGRGSPRCWGGGTETRAWTGYRRSLAGLDARDVMSEGRSAGMSRKNQRDDVDERRTARHSGSRARGGFYRGRS